MTADREHALLLSIAAHAQDILTRYAGDIGLDGAVILMQSDLDELHAARRARHDEERKAKREAEAADKAAFFDTSDK